MEDLGNAIGGLSAGGILLLLVIREFLSHMGKAKAEEKQKSSGGDDDPKLQSIDEQMKQIASSTSAICMLVEKVDHQGLPLIYRDQRLPDAVDNLNKSIEKLGDRLLNA